MNFKISIIICNTLKSLEYLKVFKNLSKEIDSIIYLDNKKNFSISKKIKKLFHLIKFKRKKYNFFKL